MYQADRVVLYDELKSRWLEFLFSEDGEVSIVLSSEDGKLWSIASLAYVDKELMYKAIKKHHEAGY